MESDQNLRPKTNIVRKIEAHGNGRGQKAVTPVVSAVIAIVITLLIVGDVVYVAYVMPNQANVVSSPNSSTSVSSATSYTSACTSGQPYYCGSLSFTSSGQDHFSSTTSYTYSTNIATTLFTNPTGNAFQSLGPIPSGGTLVTNLPPNANGIIYAEVSEQSAQNLYVDTALTMARNTPYIQGWTYQPVDNTNTNQFVFKLNTAGIPVQSGLTPTFTFYPYFIKYSTVSLTTPANITSVGSSSVNEFVQWTTSLTTVNTGAEITEAIITVNNTNPAVAQPLYLNNPTVGATGTIPLSSMTSTLLSSSYQYNYYFTTSKTTTDLSSGPFIAYGQNALNSQQWTFAYTNNFGACTETCNGLLVTLALYVLQPSGTPIVVTHAWTASK